MWKWMEFSLILTTSNIIEDELWWEKHHRSSHFTDIWTSEHLHRGFSSGRQTVGVTARLSLFLPVRVVDHTSPSPSVLVEFWYSMFWIQSDSAPQSLVYSFMVFLELHVFIKHDLQFDDVLMIRCSFTLLLSSIAVRVINTERDGLSGTGPLRISL